MNLALEAISGIKQAQPVKKNHKRRAKQAKNYRDGQRVLMRNKRADEMDIGKIPAVVDEKRRKKSKASLKYHAKAYHPDKFNKPFCVDHDEVVAKIEYAVLTGGLFVYAMPRGGGKTTFAETAIEWGMLHGHIRYAVIVGSDKDAADQILRTIKTELESNERLLADFPEVCLPIVKLDGQVKRCVGQTCDGVRTHISWKTSEVVFPTIAGSLVSGSIIQSRGLLGRIRGLKYTTWDGKSLRPDFVLPDDPQTEESAHSDSQCKRRESIIRSAILGLAGPGEEIAAVMPGTIIRKGDLIDRMLDRSRNPEWRGAKAKMVVSWPKNMSLWENGYRQAYLSGLEKEDEGRTAKEFYLLHRDELEEGAKVSWEERKTLNDVTALQHAMNLYFKLGKEAFMSEYQNDPVDEIEEIDIISKEDLERKVNGYRRGVVPVDHDVLTMFVDVHDALLYYMVCAWRRDGSGAVVDYNTYPDQKMSHFVMRAAVRKISDLFPNHGPDAAIQAALTELIQKQLDFDYSRSDGALTKITKALADSGYKPDAVKAVKRITQGDVFDASKGVGVGASARPFSEYQKKSGERHGHSWYYPRVKGTNEHPHVRIDVNYWKSLVSSGLSIPSGDPGAITLFGTEKTNHRMVAEHLVGSEYYVETEGRGRKLREWRLRPGATENHWLDCLVGCAVAASIAGVVFPGQEVVGKKKREKKRLSDMQRNRR